MLDRKFQSVFQVSTDLITDNSDKIDYGREDPESSSRRLVDSHLRVLVRVSYIGKGTVAASLLCRFDHRTVMDRQGYLLLLLVVLSTVLSFYT